MNGGEPTCLDELVQQYKAARPFMPFEIVTSRGQRCLVRVPERLIIAMRRLVYVDHRTNRMIDMSKDEIVAVKRPRLTA
jgi:hypothetical protein